MKTIKLFFGVLLFTILTVGLNAQNIPTTKSKNKERTQQNTMIRTSNSIELRGSSDTREIKVEVTDEGCNFSLNLSAEVQQGSLKIEIIDPKGKKRGTFSTSVQTENKVIKPEEFKKSNYEERIQGDIMQQNASSGIWIMKIIPSNAHGKLMFRNQQSSYSEKTNSKISE